ncbi:MAG: hypothetical protein R6T85_08815 [Egibacteraceae bacterium]
MHDRTASVDTAGRGYDGLPVGDLDPDLDNVDLMRGIVIAADGLIAALRYAARAVESWEDRPGHLAELERGLDALDGLANNLGAHGIDGARRWLAYTRPRIVTGDEVAS